MFVTLTPPTLSEIFALILDGLCRAVAVRSARNRAATPLFVQLWSRLRRLRDRLAALATRAAAGTLPTAPAASRPGRPRRTPPTPRPRLPDGYAWLIAAVPEAAAFASQLNHLLAGPEGAAFLKAAPQAGRLLRPLCRMLGIEPPPGAQPRSAPKPAPVPDPAPTKPSPEQPAAAGAGGPSFAEPALIPPSFFPVPA